MNKKIVKFLTLFVLLLFFLIANFGAGNPWVMKIRDDGTMSGCAFDGQGELCRMNFAEHISVWREIFSVTLQKNIFILNLLVLVSTFFFVIFTARRNLRLLLFVHFSERRLYLKNNPCLLFFDWLRKMFSQGILNPKIYK